MPDGKGTKHCVYTEQIVFFSTATTRCSAREEGTRALFDNLAAALGRGP